MIANSQRTRLRRREALRILTVAALLPAGACQKPQPVSHYAPGERVLLDANNCYPVRGRYDNRLRRALSCGTPLAIGEDLVWHKDWHTQLAKEVIAPGVDTTGDEPNLADYFFSGVQTVLDQVVQQNRVPDWPVIVLHLDLKTNEPAHHQALADLLHGYDNWITTAVKSGNPSQPGPFHWRPLFVLVGDAGEQEDFFYQRVPAGATLRVFGAVKPKAEYPATAAEVIGDGGNEFRRYVSLPWAVIEGEPQPRAGDWTAEKAARLRSFVEYAHAKNLWIRFHTLNGHAEAESQGWDPADNFGSLEAVRIRWKAAIEAGVDFLATDQYEQLARYLHELGKRA